MSDFLIDFRDREARRHSVGRAASLLKFCDDTWVEVVERHPFSLVLARVDEPALWGAYSSAVGGREIFLALAGRVAFDEAEWESSRRLEGTGGLACKALLQIYRGAGVDALAAKLNGNCAVFIYDEAEDKVHIVTDRAGMFLCYGRELAGGELVFSSHPDVLADVLGEEQNWDLTSLAEFLMTSRLTFPFTYFRNIKALDTGSIHTVTLGKGSTCHIARRRYFQFDFQVDPQTSEDQMAEEFAGAFKRAVRRRTLPMFGRTAIALSGGLDSRAILSAAGSGGHIFGFTLFDEENTELKVATAVARACGVEMVPIRRDFEYYGDSAELGVRISGGTGSISCNHFLGVRSHLRDLGATNLLTGCYCDYLFKGLALNTEEGKISRVQELARFQLAFYDSFDGLETTYRDGVIARLKALFPESEQASLTDDQWLDVERRRSFPLAYEQDLAQRVIPQRVLPWYLPIVDNDILNLYLRISPRFKLNASLFKKMVRLVCPPEVVAIQNSNTGAAADASWQNSFFFEHLSSLRNRISDRLRPRMATRGSWPNWSFYLRHSRRIEELWARENEAARDVFTEILGFDPCRKSVHEYEGREIWLFVRLFTQKLWFDQILSGKAGRKRVSPAGVLCG